MIIYLLPLLIANTGGRMVYGDRGGVVGTIATMGVIVGSDDPDVPRRDDHGPARGVAHEAGRQLWAGKISAGFEMLVDNFSAGILGAILAIVGFFGIAPSSPR